MKIRLHKHSGLYCSKCKIFLESMDSLAHRAASESFYELNDKRREYGLLPLLFVDVPQETPIHSDTLEDKLQELYTTYIPTMPFDAEPHSDPEEIEINEPATDSNLRV